MTRVFYLVRETDVTGVSGTGVVAEGIEFSDGTCAMRWRTATTSTAVYASRADIETIHGHQGKTRIVDVTADPDPIVDVTIYGYNPEEGSLTLPWPYDEAMVERVARALCQAGGKNPNSYVDRVIGEHTAAIMTLAWELYLDAAVAALKAIGADDA